MTPVDPTMAALLHAYRTEVTGSELISARAEVTE